MREKQRLREVVLARLNAIDTREHETLSMMLNQYAVLIKELTDAEHVMLFAPMAKEPDIWELTDALWARGKTVLLPVVSGRELLSVEYNPGDLLLSSRYGVLEPAQRVVKDPATIDVALIPGVAFDERGHRLGRGAGYYDRFLAGLGCLKIGLCFETQLEMSVPHEAHDVVMDAVCTDKRLIVASDRVAPIHTPKAPKVSQ
jgi:5-formyltetrahydrofolate cyclo-ligase